MRSATPAILAAMSLTWPLAAGPDWVEPKDIDAGSLPAGAQVTVGSGPMMAIVGRIQGVAGAAGAGADLQDLYVICIDDPEAFLSTTVELSGGFAEAFDSRLYLFDLAGVGLLGNDNTDIGGDVVVPESTLVQAADDGTGALVERPGLYILAITLSPAEPLSANGPIFLFGSPTEVSGPDGEGAGSPLIEWKEELEPATGACCLGERQCADDTTREMCEKMGGVYQGDSTHCRRIKCRDDGGDDDDGGGDGDGGDDGAGAPAGKVPLPGEYKIILAGTCFAEEAPPDCPADVNNDGIVDVHDLMQVVLEWGPCPDGCAGDVNLDGEVSVLDLTEVIFTWGPCAG